MCCIERERESGQVTCPCKTRGGRSSLPNPDVAMNKDLGSLSLAKSEAFIDWVETGSGTEEGGRIKQEQSKDMFFNNITLH